MATKTKLNYWLRIGDRLVKEIRRGTKRKRVASGFNSWLKQCSERIFGEPGSHVMLMDDEFLGRTYRYVNYYGCGGWEDIGAAILQCPMVPPEDDGSDG